MSEEESVCPICMEHPQNAILLVCSSHDKGCRPLMCDANCFQQFSTSFSRRGKNGSKLLICPLCRGSICGSTVAKNGSSSRSYSCFNCDFSGMYEDLRMHVSSRHPFLDDDSGDTAPWTNADSGIALHVSSMLPFLDDDSGDTAPWTNADSGIALHVSSMLPFLDYDSGDIAPSTNVDSGHIDYWETTIEPRRRRCLALRRQWLEDPQRVGRNWFEAFQARDNGNDDHRVRRRRLNNDDDQ